MYTPTFEDLVGDEQVFFREHFNTCPLLRRDALRVPPHDILGVSDLDQLLSHDVIRLPYLRVAKGGASVREANYSRTLDVQNETVTDAVDPDRVRELFRSGATITWNSINHFRPNLRDLALMLNEKFASRSDVIAFLTPAGRQGYAPHHDPVDVFVIQLHGTKEWQLWKTPEHRLDNTGHYDLSELGEPESRIVLRPGDVLYLPYSTPHVAATTDTMSLHLSIVVKPRMWRDLLARSVMDILDTDSQFARFPGPTAALTDTTTFTTMVDRLVHRLRDIDPGAELVRLRDIGHTTEVDNLPHNGFTTLAAIDMLDSDSSLRLSTDIDLAFGDTTDGRTTLVLGTGSVRPGVATAPTAASSATVRVPDRVANTLRALTSDTTITPVDLYPGVSHERSVSVAKSLARLGILEVAA